MQKPAQPIDESGRVEKLRSLRILDTPAEERFDRITRLAQRLFDVPIAAVSLIDSTRQWFKSLQGLDLAQISRDVSFCGHTILEHDPMIVEDTRRDPRFLDNPLVAGDPYFRFYAGYPLFSDDGSALGTLLLYDYRPRQMQNEDIAAFADLAGIAQAELLVQKGSAAQREVLERQEEMSEDRIDGLTRLWNRTSVLEILDRELEHAQRSGKSVGVLLADIDHFKKINDQLGHKVGDDVLNEVARKIRATLRPYDAVGRFGGEEFLIILPGADSENALLAAERVRVNVWNEVSKAAPGQSVAISIGVAAREEAGLDPHILVRAAERALYRAKNSGRNRVMVAKRGEGS